MASRDSTGLMVAVILLVLLTVLLSFGTYMGMTKAYENFEAFEKEKLKAEMANNQIKSEQARINILRGQLGLDGADVSLTESELATINGYIGQYSTVDGAENFVSELQKLVTQIEADNAVFAADMNRWGSADVSDADRTWRKLVDHFAQAVNAKHQELTSANNRVETAEREKENEVAQKQKQVETSLAAQKKAEDELTDEKRRHAEKEAELQSQLTAASQTNQQLNEAKTSLTTSIMNMRDDHAKEIDLKDRAFADLKSKYDAMNRKTFTIPDGKIVNVNRNSRYAYINVGQADGLRTTQTFEVFDKSETNFELENGKGKIEVIRFVEPHVAEVRITQSDALNPILPNDHIISATWDPNSPVEIALVGFIDIDGDKRSDRLRLETMIRLNGGIVVAKHDEEGNVTGEMSPNTRYLVVGIPPTEMGNDAGSEVVKAWNKINDEAGRYHIQEVSLQKFLNSMGYHGGATVERLDGQVGSRVKSNRQAQEDNSDR